MDASPDDQQVGLFAGREAADGRGSFLRDDGDRRTGADGILQGFQSRARLADGVARDRERFTRLRDGVHDVKIGAELGREGVSPA